MLNRLASLAMSTCILKALPGKLDIKRHSPSIIYILQPKKSEKEVVRTESQEFVNMTDLELSFVINEVRFDYLLLFGLRFYIPVNSYMVMLRQSVLDWDRTDDLWIYSQACYRLRYRTRCLYD